MNFFQNASGTGFANNFNADLTNLTDPTTGPSNVDLARKTRRKEPTLPPPSQTSKPS